MSSDPRTDPSPGPTPLPRRTPFVFHRPPFALSPEADGIFWTEPHGRAADDVERGIAAGAPVILLTGEIGTGKTTLARHMATACSTDRAVGLLSHFDAGHGDDLAGWALLAFGEEVPNGPPPVQYGALRSFLWRQGEAGRRCILVVDEAQAAADHELEGLRQLTNLDDGRAALQLVLVAQPELRDRLADARHASLVARIGANAHISPMHPRDTAGYVWHRLSRAGAEPSLFTARALADIHDLAAGIPRRTNMLCDRCVAEARSRGAPEVDVEIVRAAAADWQAGIGRPASDASRTPATAEPSRQYAEPCRSGAPQPPRPASVRVSARATAGAVDGLGGGWIRAAPRAANSVPQAPEPAAVPPEPAPAAPERRAPDQSTSGPDEDVQLLALSAMASLADFGAKPRKAADKPPLPRSRANPEPTDKMPVQAPGRRQLHGPGTVLAAASLGLVAVAFGYEGVWSAVDGLREARAANVLPQTAMTGAPSSVEPGQAGQVDAAPGLDQAIGVAARADPSTPRPALLTTPSLPTVAAPQITAEGLFALALDLALVDREMSAIAFARAAARGHARSAYYLAQVYETGDGMPLNPVLARAWYAAAGRPASGDAVGTGPVAPPRLLSAARTSGGSLELVWTSSSTRDGVGYLVELFDDPDGRPLQTATADTSALRIDAPEGELFWRVSATDGETTAPSDLQRIPESH